MTLKCKQTLLSPGSLETSADIKQSRDVMITFLRSNLQPHCVRVQLLIPVSVCGRRFSSLVLLTTIPAVFYSDPILLSLLSQGLCPRYLNLQFPMLVLPPLCTVSTLSALPYAHAHFFIVSSLTFLYCSAMSLNMFIFLHVPYLSDPHSVLCSPDYQL